MCMHIWRSSVVSIQYWHLVNLLHVIIGVLKLFCLYDMVTQILFRLSLPSYNTVLHNCKAIFMRTWLNSSTSCVDHVCVLFSWFEQINDDDDDDHHHHHLFAQNRSSATRRDTRHFQLPTITTIQFHFLCLAILFFSPLSLIFFISVVFLLFL